jgi:predicted ATPase/transcriptional regulator with XRE-family HTH domain
MNAMTDQSPHPPQASVGALLRRARLLAGLSQEELAGRAGISARAVSDIERGVHRAPRGATLGLLADALAVAPQERALLLAAAHPEALASDAATPPDSSTAPPAPGASATAGSLPAPPGPLYGRERELERASGWVRAAERRILTLTGPGGVGKTRLALAIAHACRDAFPDGVVFVDLTPLEAAAQVPGAIALALGLRERAGEDARARVAAALDDRRALLVLDNAERVIAAAPYLAELLSRRADLFLLVTSRLPLRLRAERVLPLGPLEAAAAEALFRDLARGPDIAGQDQSEQVAAICARLDGLPLAIELAAAQTAAMPARVILERLSDRLGALREGPSDLPARQRTMTATLDWSYTLLSGEARSALRALAIFASGWTLDAARAVISADPIPALTTLVEASLVMRDTPSNAPARWRLLDITRDYARARLRAAGEEEDAMRRLALHYAAHAERVLIRGPDQRGDRADLPNIWAALDWAERRREAELGLRLAAYGRVFHACGQLHEAVNWSERMLALDAEARASGKPVAPAPLRVSRLYGLARALMGLGEAGRAERRLYEALRLAESIKDHAGMAEAYASLGDLAYASGRRDVALAAYAESVAHASRAPHEYPAHRALARQADLADLRGDADQAACLLSKALIEARSRSATWEAGMLLLRLASLSADQQRHEQARAAFLECLAVFQTYEDSGFTARALEGLAAAFGADGHHREALRLYAGAHAMRQRGDSPAPPAERAALDEALARARHALGEPRYHAEWIAGAALAPDALITEALNLATTSSPRRSPEELDRGGA